MTQVLLPLATGFEEIEAVTIIDVLRRADIQVVVAGLTPGVLSGANGVQLQPDTTLDQVDGSAFDLIVLPGGLGGTEAMMEHQGLLELLRAHLAAERPAAAICAAPMVLAAAGVEQGLELTCHPSVRDRLGRATVRDEPRVLRCGRVMTSQGPGTAMEFALELVADLRGAEVRDELAAAMVVAQVGG